MPFVSKAQRAKLWAIRPDIARKWEALTPNPGHLPEHVPAKKKAKKRRKR